MTSSLVLAGALATLLVFLGTVSATGGEEYDPACDASRCLLDDCIAFNNSANASVYPCESPYEARGVGDEGEGMADQYTCCMPGYDTMSVEVLETCSTDACTSPDGNGGHDCLADGFIHPLVCDQDSPYKYAHKEDANNIYDPYICCTKQTDQSNRNMVIAASIWTALSGITFVACLILIFGILKSNKARAQGYNLYLVFLAIPDALFNGLSFLRNVVNLANGQLSNPMGATVHATEWFHTAANMWLNAFIVFQVHTMLLKAQRFERSPPTTTKQVLCQVGVIYIFAGMWAAWSLILLLQGSAIFANTNAAWLTSKSLMCGPPFLYTTGACLHVWWKKLLPTKGRTRTLSLYFLRVVMVFLLTWVPFLILVDVTYYKTASLWMLGLAYYFASLQGLLSVTVAMTKPDVKRAVLNLLCCRPDEFSETEAGFLLSRVQKIGQSIMPSKFFTSRQSSRRFRSSMAAVSELREEAYRDQEVGKDATESTVQDTSVPVKATELDETVLPKQENNNAH